MMRWPAILVMCAGVAWAVEPSALAPAALYDDFQNDNLSQWSSYPPVQDIGYDPSLTPTSEYDAPGGRSLMRVYQPVSSGLMRIGFIKRLNLASPGVVEVNFAYRIKPWAPGTQLEVGLAGQNGTRYRQRVATASDGWSQAVVRLSEIPAGVGLQAIYITANVAKPDTDAEYRFLLDNVSVKAARRVGFDVRTPLSTAIDPFEALVSSVTYAAGETIAVKARCDWALSKTAFTLKNARGQAVKSGTLELREGSWQNPDIYRIVNADGPGIWVLELRGNRRGRTVTTEVRLIVRKNRESPHPRLFFRAREELLERSRDRQTANVWEKLMQMSKSWRATGNIADGAHIFDLLDAKYLLPTLPGYFDVFNRASNCILYDSLDAYVTGSSESLRAAKSALLDVARWNRWAPPWFPAHGQFTYYPAGELSGNVAFAYDALYDSLTAAERTAVKGALRNLAIEAAYNEYVVDNRCMADTSNWIGHSVGGGILAALAIMDRDDDPELNRLLGGLLIKLENHLAASYLRDGSYGEGTGYQEFDLKTTTLALAALKRTLGIDLWSRSFVRDSLVYPLYTLAIPRTHSLGMGDNSHASGYTSAPIVQQSDDPAMQWYYQQFEHHSLHDFLFPVKRMEASPPSRTSRIFENKGDAVFRTGWAEDDAILLFRAGPNFNHNHADQGSFLLRAWGEDLVVEAGPADYYKDPYYRSYFSQAEGHNTVLVNGDPASQEVADTAEYKALDAHPRITDAITSDFFDAVGSELASVYRGRLAAYSRRIQFLKPDLLVVDDNLAAHDEPLRFDWLLHVADRSKVRITGKTAVYEGARASLGVTALAPDAAGMRVRDGHLTFAVFSPVAPKEVPVQPGILDIISGDAAKTGQFLVVLSIGHTADEASRSIASSRRLTGSNCEGVAVGGNLFLFRGRSGAGAAYADWRTDAAAWSAAGPILSAQHVTSLVRGRRTLAQSDRPISFAARSEGGSFRLSVASDEAATLRIYTGFRPAQIAAEDYDAASGMSRLRVPSGGAEMTLRQ